VNLDLTDEQQAVRELFSDLFVKEATPARIRAAEPVGHDSALWAHMIETGLLGIGVPEADGGAGAGLLELTLVAEEAGRRLAPIPLAEPAAAARLLARCGASSLLDEVLEGSTLLSLATRDRPVGDQLLTDGAIADAVLAVEDDHLIVAWRPEEVRHIPNAGSLPLARWSDPHTTSLASGEQARSAFDTALDEARVLRAAMLTGLAFEAIEIGAGYARERRAFGIPIGTYQAVAHPLADAIVAADGAQLLHWKACWALDENQPSGPSLASMALIFAGQTAYFAAQQSLHVHGGYGFMEEYDIQLYFRRAKAWHGVFNEQQREIAGLADRRFGVARVPHLQTAAVD
jgi:alkylation response protein AidB-like acyl-CoA dehydrogenase